MSGSHLIEYELACNNIIIYIYIASTLENEKQTFEKAGKLISYSKLAKKRTYKILREVAEGLYFLHKNGIIHFDLKPDNILLSNEDTAKIGDFGTAILDADTRDIGSKFETLLYSAQDNKKSFEYDIYSFGCVASEIAAHSKEYIVLLRSYQY